MRISLKEFLEIAAWSSPCSYLYAKGIKDVLMMCAHSNTVRSWLDQISGPLDRLHKSLLNHLLLLVTNSVTVNLVRCSHLC